MDPRLFVFLGGAVLLLVHAVRRYLTGRHLRNVRGPKSPSWLLGECPRLIWFLALITGDTVGHNQEMVSYLEVGDFEAKCMAEYGMAWRLKDCMGVSAIADES